VQWKLVKELVLPCLLADRIAGSVGPLQRLAQCLRLFGGRQQLQGKGDSASSLAASVVTAPPRRGGVSALFFR
jgi:hypothetical protein